MSGFNEDKDKNIEELKSEEKKVAIGDSKQQKLSKIITETFEETYEITETTLKLKNGDNFEEIRKIINQSTIERSNSDRKGRILIDLETIAKKGDDEGDKNFILTEKSFEKLNKDGKYKQFSREIEIVREKNTSAYNNSDKIKDIRKIVNRENVGMEESVKGNENNEEGEKEEKHGAGGREETYADKIDKIKKIINQEVTNKETEGKILIDIEEIIKGKNTITEEKENDEIEEDKDREDDSVSDNLKLEFKGEETVQEKEQRKELKDENKDEHELELECKHEHEHDYEHEHELKKVHDNEQERKHERVIYATTVDEIDNILKIINQESEEDPKEEGKLLFDMKEITEAEITRKESQEDKTTQKIRKGSKNDFIKKLARSTSKKLSKDSSNKSEEIKVDSENIKVEEKGKASNDAKETEQMDKLKKEISQDENVLNQKKKPEKNVFVFLYNENKNGVEDLVSKKKNEESNEEKGEPSINEETENKTRTLHTNETKEEAHINKNDVNQIYEVEMNPNPVGSEKKHLNDEGLENTSEECENTILRKEHNDEKTEKEIEEIRRVINQEATNDDAKIGKILIDLNEVADRNSDELLKESKHEDDSANKSTFSNNNKEELAKITSRKPSTDSSSSNKTEEIEAEDVNINAEEKGKVCDDSNQPEKTDELKKEISQEETDLNKKRSPLIKVHEFLYKDKNDGGEMVSKGNNMESNTKCSEKEEEPFETNTSVNRETESEENILGNEQNEEINEKEIEEIRKVINQEATNDEGKTGKILIDLDKEVTGINDADDLLKSSKNDENNSNKSKFSIKSIKKLVRKLSKDSKLGEFKVEHEDIKADEKEKVSDNANEPHQNDEVEKETSQEEAKLKKEAKALTVVHEFLCDENKIDGEDLVSKEQNEKSYTVDKEEKMEKPFEENASIIDETKDYSKKLHTNECIEPEIKEEAHGNENAADQIGENTKEVELNTKPVESEEKHKDDNCQCNLNEGFESTSEECEKTIVRKEQKDETNEKEIEEIKKVINQESSDDEEKIEKFLIDLDEVSDIINSDELLKGSKHDETANKPLSSLHSKNEIIRVGSTIMEEEEEEKEENEIEKEKNAFAKNINRKSSTGSSSSNKSEERNVEEINVENEDIKTEEKEKEQNETKETNKIFELQKEISQEETELNNEEETPLMDVYEFLKSEKYCLDDLVSKQKNEECYTEGKKEEEEHFEKNDLISEETEDKTKTMHTNECQETEIKEALVNDNAIDQICEHTNEVELKSKPVGSEEKHVDVDHQYNLSNDESERTSENCEKNIPGMEQNEETDEKEIEEIRKVINQEDSDDEGKTGKILIDLDKEIIDIGDGDELSKGKKDDDSSSNKSKFSIQSIKKLVRSTSRKLSKESTSTNKSEEVNEEELKIENEDIKGKEKEKVKIDANEIDQIDKLENEITQKETELNKDGTPLMDVYEFLRIEKKDGEEEMVSTQKNKKFYTECNEEENSSINEESDEAKIKEEARGNENAVDQICENTNEVELNAESVRSEEKNVIDNHQYNLNDEGSKKTSEESENNILEKEQNDETDKKEIEEIKKIINQKNGGKVGQILIDLNEITDTSDDNEMCSKKKVCNGILSSTAIDEKENLLNDEKENFEENSKTQNDKSEEIKGLEDIKSKSKMDDNTEEMNWLEHCILSASEVGRFEEEIKNENDQSEEHLNENENNDDHVIGKASENLTKNILKTEITDSENECGENNFTTIWDEKIVETSINKEDKLVESTEKKMEIHKDSFTKSMNNSAEKNIKDDKKHDYELQKINENKTNSENDNVIEQIRKIVNQDEHQESSGKGKILIDLESITDQEKINNQGNDKITEIDGEKDLKGWTQDKNNEIDKLDKDKQDENADNTIKQIREMINQGIDDNNLEEKLLINLEEKKQGEINKLNDSVKPPNFIEHSRTHSKEMDEDMKQREEEFNKVWKPVTKEEIHNKVEEIRKIVSEETISEVDEDICLRNNATKGNKREKITERLKQSSFCKLDKSILQRNSVDGVVSEFLARKESFKGGVDRNSIDDGKNISSHNCCASENEFCNGGKLVQGELDINDTNDVSSSNCLQSRGGKALNSNYISNDTNNTIPGVKGDDITTSNKLVDSGSNTIETIMENKVKTSKFNTPKTETELSANSSGSSENNEIKLHQTKNVPEIKSFNKNWLVTDDDDILKSLVTEREKIDFKLYRKSSDPSGMNKIKSLGNIGQRKSVSFEDFQSNDEFPKRRSEDLRIEMLRKMKKMHEMKAFQIRKSLSYDGDDILGILDKQIEDEEPASKSKINPLDELDQLMKMNSKRKTSSLSVSLSYDERGSKTSLSDESDNEDFEKYPKNKFSKLDQTANTLKVYENKSFPIRHSLSYEGEDILNVLSNGDGDSSPENQSRVQTVDVEIHENNGISSIHKCKDIKESYQNHLNNPCSTFLDPITNENAFSNSDTLNNTINNGSCLSDQKTCLDSVKKHVDADATENIQNRNCDENSYNKVWDSNNILPENVNESKEPSKISLSLSDDEKHNLTFDHPIPPLRKRRYTSMPVLNDTADEVDFAKTMEAVAPPRKRSLQRKMNGKLSGTVSCSLSNISSYNPDVNFLEEINSSTKLKHSVDDMFLPRHTSPVSFASPEVSNIVHERNYGVRASVQLLDSPMGTGSETLPFTTKKTPHIKKKSYTFTKGDTYMADVRNNIKKKKKHRSVSSLFRRTFSMNDVKKPDNPPCLPNLFKRLRHKKNKHQCDLNNLPPIKEDYTLQNSNTAESFASIFMSDEEEDAYLEKCIGERQKTESFISLRFPENLQRSMSSVDVSKYASSSIKKSPLITKKKKSDVLMRIGSGHRSLRKRLRRPHIKNLKHDTSTVSLDAEALKNAKELLDRTLASKLESQKTETPTLPEPLQNRPSIILQQYSDIAEDTDNIEEKEDNKDQLETPVLKSRKDRGFRGSLKSMFLSEKKSDAVKRQLSFSIPAEQNQKSDAQQLSKEETLESLKKLAEEHKNSEKDRVKFLKEEAKSLENISNKIHSIHDSQEDYHERVMRKFVRRYSQDIMNISNSEGKLEELTNKYKVPFEDDMDKINQIAGKEILGIENIDHHSMNKINLFDSEQRMESFGLSLTASSVNESDSSRVSPSTGTPSNELNFSYEDLDKLEKESSKMKPENINENSKYQIFKFPYVNREKFDDDFPINKETLIKECLDGTLNLKLQNIVKDSEEIIDPDVLETDSTHLLALAYEKEIYRHMREHLNSSGSIHDLDIIQKLANIYEEELLSYFDIKGKNVMKLAASEITQRRGSIINLEMLMDTKLNKENLIKECLDGTLNIKLKNAIRENDKIWDPNRLEVDTTKLLALEYEKEILQHMKENFDLYDENEELKTIRKLVRIYEDELLTRFDVKGENFLKLADKEITQRRGSVLNLKRIREFIEEYGSRFQSESDDSDSELLQIPQAKTKARKSVSIEDSATVITNIHNHHPYFTLISDLEKETPSSVSEKNPDHIKHSNFNVSGQESPTLIDKTNMNESTEDLDSNNDKDNKLNDDINKDIIALGNEYEDEILAHAFRLSLQRFSSAPKLKRVSSQSENKTKNIPKFSFQSMKNKSQDLFKNVRRYSSPILTKAFSFELPSKRPISPTTTWNKYSIDHPIIEGIVSKEVENYPQLPEWVRFQPLSLAKLSSNVYFGNKKHDIFSKMMNTSESINKFIRSASISNSLSFDEKPTTTIKQPADNIEVNPYRGLGPSIQHLYVARSNSLITYESSPPHSPVFLSGENKSSENQTNDFQASGFSRSPVPEGKIARHFPYENKETTFDRKSPRSSPDSFDSLLNDNEIKTFLDAPKNNYSSFEENTERGGNRIVHSPLTKRKFFVSPVPSDASYTSFSFDDNPENKEKDESSSAHYFKPIEGESTDCSPNKISVKRAYLNTKPIQRSFAIDISSESLSDSHSITSQDSDTTPKTDFSKTDLVDDCYNPNLTNVQAKDDGISEDYQSQALKDQTLLDQESQEFEISSELSENNQVQEKSSNESHEDSDTNSQTCKDNRKSFANQRVPTIEVSDISSENEISFERSDPEDFNGRNVQSDDNLSEKVSDSHKISSNEVRSNESFDSLSSSDDNEILLRPINEDTNIIKEKCSLNCECELHGEDSDPVKILAVQEKPESPDYVLRTWYERQEIPDGFSSPSPVIIPKWVKSDESSDDSDIRSRKDTPSPAPPTDKVARSSSHSPDEVDSKKEEERIQKDRCIEVYPETVRQRQRTMAPSPSKVDIKNWEPTEDSKKFLPSVKALRNQFENGKSKNDNTLVRTPSDSSSANSLILNSLDASSGFGSLTSSQANTEQTSEGPKLTPRDPNEPVEPIFSQFREVDEEFKEMMSKPPSTQGWNPQTLLKRLYYVPDAPKMHRREVPFINIEGYLEKLPSGRKKATFWNAWKRRYFVAKDGILFYYQNNQSEKPNMKLSLIGGKIEIMDPSMISVEDGGRESRSAGMLGIDDGKGHYVVVRCPSRQEAERWKEALESHTYDDFTSQYIQPWPRPTNPTLLRDTLVIDIGSCSVRAGVLASQPTLPQVFFPSVVATNRETKAQIWGIEALMPDIRPTSSISFPIRPSHKISKFSVDLNAVSSLLQKTFNDLKVDPKNYNIQLSVPRVLNPHTQAELLKILFDKYGVKSVNMTHQSILALYAYNATSGIIVDIGERLDVVPVIDGYIVDGGVSRVPYGGYRITDHLRQFLFQKNISLINEIDSYVIRMILESICYCAQHYNTEKQRCTMNPENFEKLAPLAEFFSDDPRFDTFRNLSLDFGRFQATEGLFNPDAWGLDHPGLHKLVHKAIQECSMDIRKELSRSIFLVGGVSQLPGIVDRLTVEIDNLTPPAIRPKVHASPYRYHASFLGACILAESDAFGQSKITKEEWTKQGNSALRKWAL